MRTYFSRKASINPYRILWHSISGLAVFAILKFTFPSTRLAALILLISFILLLIIDILRFTTGFGHDLFWRYLNFLTSDREKRGPNTSLYYSFSLLLCIRLYTPEIAMGSIICLAVGDVAANIFGNLFGRHRIGKKSIEGALANFAICFVILYFVVPSVLIAFAGALTGAMVEFLPIPLVNDNISIPLISGLAMTLVA